MQATDQAIDRLHVPQLLLKPKDAAAALSISERTLWGLTKEEKIRCIKIGTLVRYSIADLQMFIAGGSVDSKSIA